MKLDSKHTKRRRDKLLLGHVRSIVAAFDGSADAKRALREARRLAQQHLSRLAVVQVVPAITCQVDYGYGRVTRVLNDVEAETSIRRHLNRMLRTKNDLPRPEIVVRRGNPWEQIRKTAAQLHADLIVMASHPHELPESPVSSNVENHDMSACPCATPIVKPGESN